jgi:diadenosine tetraphosphate (Ap4A) HIT family hydrolase
LSSSPAHPTPPCELCAEAGGTLLWQNALCRVVAVADPDYPGLCRVILNRHAREMTDLEATERRALLDVVFAVETTVRETMQPDKMNLASLGNMTPHVHWHVIPRFRDDPHFPGPVWAPRQRASAIPAERREGAARIAAALAARLGEG